MLQKYYRDPITFKYNNKQYLQIHFMKLNAFFNVILIKVINSNSIGA